MHETYPVCNNSPPCVACESSLSVSIVYFKSADRRKMNQNCNYQFVFLSPDDDEKAKRDAGKWWKPWVSQPGGEQQLHADTRGQDAES